jgi:hypothetical protein
MITANLERLAEIHRRLSSIGWLMRSVAEPIVHHSNREDEDPAASAKSVSSVSIY